MGSNAENNGGKTNYYNLPRANREELRKILEGLTEVPVYNFEKYIEEAIDKIYELFPDTLNDLIEHKDMKPWQHEVFKACYALEDRAKKGEFASEEREINKIIYYAKRGLNLLTNKS